MVRIRLITVDRTPESSNTMQAKKKKDPYEENLLEHVEFEHQLYFKSMNTSSLTLSFRIF